MNQSEIERLRHLQDAFKQQIISRDAQLDELSQGEGRKSLQQERFSKVLAEQNTELDRNLKETESKLKELLDEKEDLRKLLNIKSQEFSELSEECQSLHKELFESKDKRLTGGDFKDETSRSHMSESSYGSSVSIQELMIIESLAELDIRRNPLLEVVSKIKREPPMSYSNVWKLFENMMQEKYKLDRLETAVGRTPRPMIDYILDFVYLQYGLKSLANKQLKALMTSLEELNKLNHPYGTIFSRLLGVFHQRPLNSNLAVYIMVANELFNSYSSKARSSLGSFAQHYELQQYGGQCSIVDAMEIIMKLCKNQRDRGERIILSLKKDTDHKIDMIIIKICGTMFKMNKNSDFFLEIFNLGEEIRIDYHEFVDAIRIKLNIWVTQEEAEDLCAFIDEDAVGSISYEEWKSKIVFDKYLELANSSVAAITKAQLFNALIEEYEIEIVQEYNELRQTIRISQLDEKQFNKYIKEIDPTLEEHDIARLYEEARSQDMDLKGVSAETLCLIVLKRKIGGYGIGMFDINEIDSIIPRSSSDMRIQ